MIRRVHLAALAGLVLTTALALAWLYPLLWAIDTSLKQEFQTIEQVPSWIPNPPTIAAYAKVLTSGGLVGWYANSMVVAIAVTLATITLSSLAAYGFSQLRFRGRAMLFWLFLASIMVPFESLVIPLFQQMNRLGLVNSYAGIILPQLTTPLAIFIFKRFFDQIPGEFREAAVLDGAREMQILLRIYLPISRGIVSAVAIVVFIASWNNFLWPFLVITSPGMMTIPVGLTQVQSEFGIHNASNMALAVLGGLPVAVLYLLFQRRVSEGFLAATGLKG
jgi:multiple sugar transport system permease protein